MGLVFGMDEAGYGPNLGPLVITVTVWEVPGSPHEMDFWNALSPIVARPNEAIKKDRILVGDSKQVYSPARGLGLLEEAVLTILSHLHPQPACFRTLHQALAASACELADSEPWYQTELAIPCSANPQVGELAERWQRACEEAGIVLRGVVSDLVLTERYNEMVSQYNSKGLALSRMSLALLRTLWEPEEGQSALIVADKHGGRNRYDELLAEVLDGQFIFRLEEGTARSRYRIGDSELWFQTGAESHFPCAVASMVSKYLRELAMICFNRFWQTHLPDLKPTKGYPVDARRFRQDIAEIQQQLGITDANLWRER